MTEEDKPRLRLLRMSEVVQRTGLSRATIYRLMAHGKFPRQVMITERRVGWDEDQIQNWILSKLERVA